MALERSRRRSVRAVVFGLVTLTVAGALWRVARAATSDQVKVGVLSTIAGTGIAGYNGDGTATSAQLAFPDDVAVDAAGNVYIADTANNRIRKIAAGTGTMSTFAGTGAYGDSGDAGLATAATLRAPNGVAVDTSGNVYIADTNNSRIRKVAAGTNIITTVAGNGSPGYSGDGAAATTASLNSPTGLALDSSGNLYVADSGNHCIRKVTAATGLISTVAGTGAAGYNGDGVATGAQLNYPADVAVDAAGNVYIADTNNWRIRKVAADTGVMATIAGTGTEGSTGEGGPSTSAQIGYVWSLLLDSSGNLYFSDLSNNRVRKVAPSNGILTTVAGSANPGFGGDGGAAPAGTLNAPRGIAVDSAGAVYIADSGNSRVRKVSAPSVTSLLMTTVAGTGTGGYNGDGAATSAQLNYPADVAVDAAGNVYIADTWNSRVRKVTAASGSISTYAGTGGFGDTGDNGPATSATFGLIYGLALDSAGNLYLSDSHDRVRRISAATGIITAVAGSGSQGYSGDGAAATTASLHSPIGLALDSSGNLYIADQGNNRIRKVTAATGLISTVAGTGTYGARGDGGAATVAQLGFPQGVAVDSAGNIYIADRDNYRVRKVTAATGLISTVAGTGTAGYGGENGPATSAQLGPPWDVVVDRSDNVIIADSYNHRVRKLTVSNGVLTTLAGNGQGGFDGDGSVAPAASLQYPSGVAVDAFGSVYIADTDNHRVRKAEVPLNPPMNLAPVAAGPTGIRLTWTAVAGATSYAVRRGTAPGTETLLATNVVGTTYTDNTAVRGTRYYYLVAANFPSGSVVNSSEVSFRLTTVPGDVSGDGLADLLWHNASTGTNRIWFMSGTTLAGQSDYPTVADPAWQLVASADFNDDTHLDLLWRNLVTGANVVWYMNGTTFLGQDSLPTVADPAWQIVTTADMNQDGKPDIIWHNLTLGSNVVWFMNGATFLSQGTLPTVTDAAWVLAGTGDFNVDGAPDLVWRNLLTGQNVVWLMNGVSVSATANLPTVNDPTWVIEAVLDLNEDGWADVIWRNTATGANVAWVMQGTTFVDQITLPTVTDQTWQMIGRPLADVPADINGDRHPDLVWRNTTTGANVVWYLNGTQFLDQASLPTVPDTAWQMMATADLNRDGHPDLIWRNATTGADVVWYMNGTTFLGQGSLPTVPDPAWQIVAAVDMDGDRHPDLVWRNSVSGANVIWYLNDTELLGQAAFTSVTDPNWRIVAAADVNGDTRPDLIWRNAATGANVVWYMNNTTWLGQGVFTAVDDLTWQIVGSVDVNGDGYPDLIWRNLSTGSNLIWYLNGTTLLNQELLPAVPDLSWVLRPN